MRGLISLEDRFWPKVEIRGPDDCWPWKASDTGEDGYGKITVDGKNTTAHRVAWMLKNGPIPEGTLVRHRCDSPPCCNPSHLELGTQADNVRDGEGRGRSAKGEKSGNSKLTEEIAREIRERGNEKRRGTYADLAREYGVDKSTVSRIARGKSWAWLD